jgi:hypothetical protein
MSWTIAVAITMVDFTQKNPVTKLLLVDSLGDLSHLCRHDVCAGVIMLVETRLLLLKNYVC